MSYIILNFCKFSTGQKKRGVRPDRVRIKPDNPINDPNNHF